jgi:hypothetical protein
MLFSIHHIQVVDDDMPKSSNKRLSMEGEYSTVDEDTRISLNERLSLEGNYSTVDNILSGNLSSLSSC